MVAVEKYELYVSLCQRHAYLQSEIARLQNFLHDLPQELHPFFSKAGFPHIIHGSRVLFFQDGKFYSNRIDYRVMSCDEQSLIVEFRDLLDSYVAYADQMCGYLDEVQHIDQKIVQLKPILIEDIKKNGRIYTSGYLFGFGSQGISFQPLRVIQAR